MTKPSFEKINYSVRPNKNVQRKLIVEILQRLGARYPISEYRYIGMGSMWFTDFALFHRALGIKDMISIERDAVDRALFNAPFGCITVEEGETTSVLPDLSLSEKPTLLWLDYDSGIEGPVLEDSRLASADLASMSILVLTVDASRTTLKETRDPNGEKLTREEALRFYCGELAPARLPKGAFSIQGYPRLLSRILTANVDHVLRKAGRTERYTKLFDFTYSDGTPMVTVGGMIASEGDRLLLRRCNLRNLSYLPEKDGIVDQFKIDVPHLTPKEKMALDQILPSESHPSMETLATKVGFKLKPEHLRSYGRFYRHYPVFGEYLF